MRPGGPRRRRGGRAAAGARRGPPVPAPAPRPPAAARAPPPPPPPPPAAGAAAHARPRALRPAGAPALAARILAFQAGVIAHERFIEAAAAFATEAATHFGFDRAAIGFVERGRTLVVAISHAAEFEPNAALFTAFRAAMEEALDQ